MPKFPAKMKAFRPLFSIFMIFFRHKNREISVYRRHFSQTTFFVLFLPLYRVFTPVLMEIPPKSLNRPLLYRLKTLTFPRIFYTLSSVFCKINPFYPKSFLWSHKFYQVYSTLCIFYNSIGFISLLLVPFSRKQPIGATRVRRESNHLRVSQFCTLSSKGRTQRQLFFKREQPHEKR